jgi:hypothetical protein
MTVLDIPLKKTMIYTVPLVKVSVLFWLVIFAISCSLQTCNIQLFFFSGPDLC